ncbi:MAG: class I SAM-dependent methyltransferase [Granulosicoccaceae bacterium]
MQDDSLIDLKIDLVGGASKHRRQFGGGRGQPLARALGLNKDKPFVVDATAGTASDAWVIASLGCDMVWVERHVQVHKQLELALNAALQNPDTREIAERVRLIHADASDYLEQLEETERPDVVYLDPMYPHKSKSAASRGPMQALQSLLGPDTDSERLLAAALHQAKRRVVVKRPRKADPIAGPMPSGAVPSPNTRYDIYGGALLRPQRL